MHIFTGGDCGRVRCDVIKRVVVNSVNSSIDIVLDLFDTGQGETDSSKDCMLVQTQMHSVELYSRSMYADLMKRIFALHLYALTFEPITYR